MIPIGTMANGKTRTVEYLQKIAPLGFECCELFFGETAMDVSDFPALAGTIRETARELGLFVAEYYRRQGVETVSEDKAVGFEESQGLIQVRLASGSVISTQTVVVGIGVEPEVDLAEAAGLDVDDGIVVDEFTRTTDPDVYAAGDVASFHSPTLGKRLRVEHEDNANTMGRLAGRNMAGAGEVYHHLPAFYSDLFELGYEAVGEVEARLQTVPDWKTPFREGVVYYLRDQRVRGVLLWNVWGQVDAARALLAEPGPLAPRDLIGRIGAK